MKGLLGYLLAFSLFLNANLNGQSLEDHRIWFANGEIGSIDFDGGNNLIAKTYSNAHQALGYQPSSLIMGNDGVLYGTMDSGHIFQINADGTGYSIKYGISGLPDGNKLLQAADGDFYGMSTNGFIYRAKMDGSRLEVIYTFTNSLNGSLPVGSLVQDADGALYGLCYQGGTNNQAGVIFKLNTDGSGFSKLFDFSLLDGENPFALLLGSNGDLYGSTLFGGT